MPASNRSTQLKSVVMVASGNFLEMYDFMIFGYYAAAIGLVFFPSGSELTSLMLSLTTFGAGFLMRPVGAVVLGAYMDKHGRRAGLLLTLGLMAIGTLTIALVPGYATWGLIAPLLVLVGRLVQGLSAGVEVGGVSVYLSEIATPGHKGFYVSWQSASQQLAVVFTALLGLLLTQVLSRDQLQQWGWRIPLLIGGLLVPLIYVIRRSLPESREFLARRRRPSFREVISTIIDNRRVVVLGTMVATMTTVSFYLITAYTPTFGTLVLKLDARDALLVTLCVGLSNFILLPTMGALSDRIGRRRQLIICSVVALLTGYPALAWLVAQPSLPRLLAVELWLSLVYAGYNGAMVVYLTEIMPASVRTTGFSLAYSLATAIFGGFTPAICTYLIHVTGNRAMPGVWLSVAASVGLVAVIALGSWRADESDVIAEPSDPMPSERLPEAAPTGG